MIRPEVSEMLRTWREVLAAGLLCAFGLFVALTAFGFATWAGWLMAAVAVPWLYQAVQRARFPHGEGGAGVVEVRERQITYFAPTGGGTVEIDALVRVTIQTTRRCNLIWQFDALGGDSLAVSGNATGSEALFDALSALQGVDYEAPRRAANATKPGLFLVWQSSRAKAHTALH
ncbi:MAG: hypothetical protein AAGD04_08245 [Pseudomonadota bacterium]